MTTTVKINVDKAPLKTLFKTIAKINDELNEISFVHGTTRRRLQIKAQAQAADFYTPNQFTDTIVLRNGSPWMRGWPDHELVNTKPGWESLGVINGNLISGDHYDYAGNAYPIPQTMAGVEIDVDSDEYQEWYRAFTTFPSQAISEAQHQINSTINKYVEGGNRTNRQKQGFYYGTERWRDLKITLQNRLSKVKSGLRSQLAEVISKSIYNTATFIESQNNIETLVSMIELAFGLPYKHEDSTVAINIVDAQLELDLSQSPFAKEQERFEMMRILNDERVEYSKGKVLDLELLLNRIGSVFKPIEDETPEEESLQAALSAQVRKNEYKGVQGKDRVGPKQNQNPKPDRIESEPDSKLIRLILDLKAEIGVLRKALTTHGITIESAPTKNKEQSAIGKQNGKFAGIAKKRTRSRRPGQQRSLVDPPNVPSDSDDEPQEQAYSMVMVKRKSKTISPRSMNAMHVGYTRYDHKDAACNRERVGAVERELSSDEIEAQMSVNGSMHEELFGDDQAQDPQPDRDAMDARVEVQDPSMDSSNTCEQSQDNDGDSGAEEPVENQATDGDESIIDETLDISTVKDRTRSKSKKYVIPTSLTLSDSEDEMPRPSRRQRAKRGSGAIRAGVTAKFIRRNSNKFPSTASKKLQSRKDRAGSSKSK